MKLSVQGWVGTAILFCCSAALHAQVGVPTLGYVPDGGHIRPVYGIPAGAAIQTRIDYGRTFAKIAISPRQDYAIASDSGTGAVFLLNSTSSAPLQGAASSPDRIDISPQGSSAALWFSSSSKLQIFSGMPGAPKIREVNLSVVHGLPEALAVTDDGALAVGSWPDGLYSIGPNGELARIPLRERAAALTFYIGTHDLAAATNFGILSIADAGGRAVSSSLYRADLQPVGIAVSGGNRWLVVADASGSLVSISSSATSQIDCACKPEGVFPLGPSAFRVTGFNDATFRLFDPPAGQLYFVPLAGGVQ